MGDVGSVFDLTGESEGLGSTRAPSLKLMVGGMNGGLPAEPSSGDGGKGLPLVKLLLRSRGGSLASGDGAVLEDPEGLEFTASCEMDTHAAARSGEGSGRERFQYGMNLVPEGPEVEGSLRDDADATGEAEVGFTASFAGLALLMAISEELPGAVRGRGRGRLLLVGEVGEADGKVETSFGDGSVMPDLGSEPGPSERAWDGGEVGIGGGPGVGSRGRKAREATWDGGAPGVGSGLPRRPLETGLVGGEE